MASSVTSSFGRRKLIFFTDSRGLFLNELIVKEFGRSNGVEVLHYKGAGIGTLIKNAYYYAESRPFDVLFIAGGICNITSKDHDTKEIFFEWEDPVTLAKHVIDVMEEEEITFKKEVPASNVIYCNMVGANLSSVLKRDAKEEQMVLNEAIYMINEDIFQKNIVKKMYAPDLASPVHRKINGENMTFLHHLSTDGIHLGADLKRKWARKMFKTSHRYLN